MKEKIRKMVVPTLVIIIILLLSFNVTQRTMLKSSEDLLSSLGSELLIWKDKDSLSHAKIQTIKTENAKDFISLATQDSTIKALQETVKQFKKYLKNHGSVTNVTNITSIVDTTKTIVSMDTITNKPTYTSTFSLGNNWVNGNIVAKFDSTSIRLNVRNEYSVIIGEEKDGLFKKKSFVEVINKNPYSITESVRTYEVEKRNKKFHVGPYAGIGIGSGLTPQLNVGIGVTYSLFKF